MVGAPPRMVKENEPTLKLGICVSQHAERPLCVGFTGLANAHIRKAICKPFRRNQGLDGSL